MQAYLMRQHSPGEGAAVGAEKGETSQRKPLFLPGWVGHVYLCGIWIGHALSY